MDSHTVELDKEVKKGLLLAFPKMQFIDDRLGRLPTRVKQTIAYFIGLGSGEEERKMIQKYYDGFVFQDQSLPFVHRRLPNYNRGSTFRSRLRSLPDRVIFTKDCIEFLN